MIDLKIEDIINALKQRMNELKSYRTLEKARFFLGNAPGTPERLDYDDNSWKDVNLPHNWDNLKDAWFRIKVKVPEKIGEVYVTGSEMKIRGIRTWPNPVINTHGQLFIDGNMAIEAPNWFDLSFYNLVAKDIKPGDEHIVAIHAFGRKGAVVYYSEMPQIEIRFSKVDDLELEIEAFIEEIKFAQWFPGGTRVLNKSFKSMDSKYILNLDLNDLIDFIHNIEDKMASLEKFAKEYEIYLAGHAHIDIMWL